MPHPEFFQKLGLFVANDVFDLESCARLRSEMRDARMDKGLVRGDAGLDGLDESIRRVSIVRVPKPTKLLVRSKLDHLRARVEEHFQVSVTGYEEPQFLMYGPGAFYKPHKDARLERQVSVVIFLNSETEAPAEETYGGGALTFYGLLPGPQWEECGFPLDASAGLLIAFRPNVIHEVRPVTFGQRYTIVSWYTK